MILPKRSRIKGQRQPRECTGHVLDDNNRPAPDLPVEAFQIFEEGVKQKIEVFDPKTKQHWIAP